MYEIKGYMIIISTHQQIEDFTRGCCFFATGGGAEEILFLAKKCYVKL